MSDITNNFKDIGWTSQFAQRESSKQGDREWNIGNLVVGIVLKVHPKRYTADVRVSKTGELLRDTTSSEGRFACRILTASAGFSTEYETPYGEIRPLHVGDLVLVGFLRNKDETPVILGSFHDIAEDVGMPNFRNILPLKYNPNEDEITDYLHISPIQDFKKIDKQGNFEISSHTKSFVVGMEKKIDDEVFDYEDLSVKYPNDKSVVSTQAHASSLLDGPAYNAFSLGRGNDQATIHVRKSSSAPKNYLAVFRNNFYDHLTGWLRFSLNASKLSFKMLQSRPSTTKKADTSTNSDTSVVTSNSSNLIDESVTNASDTTIGGSTIGKGTMTVLDLEESGTIRIRRHLDTHRYKTNNSLKKTDSKHFADVQVNKDGSIVLEIENQYKHDTNGEIIGVTNFVNYPKTVVSIDGTTGEVKVTTTSKVSIVTKKGIDLKSNDDIRLQSEKQIKILSKKGILMGSEKEIGIVTKDALTATAGKTLGLLGTEGAAFSSDLGPIEVTGTKGVAVLSQAGTVGIGAVKGITAVGSTIKTVGSQTHTGTYKGLGANTLIGKQDVIGTTITNGRVNILDGDQDSAEDTSWDMYNSVIVSILEQFALEQATSMVVAEMPEVASLASVVAKGFMYYQSDSLGIRSLQSTGNNLNGSSFDMSQVGLTAVSVAPIISDNSEFKDPLVEFQSEYVKGLKKENDLFGRTETDELLELSGSLQNLVETSELLNDLEEDEDIDLGEKHNFVSVSDPFNAIQESGVTEYSRAQQAGKNSVLVQMKFLTSKLPATDENGNPVYDENGNQVYYGLGLNLEEEDHQEELQDIYAVLQRTFGTVTDEQKAVAAIIISLQEYWNKFSKYNDLVDMIECVCDKNYAPKSIHNPPESDTVLVSPTGVPGLAGSLYIKLYYNQFYQVTAEEKEVLKAAFKRIETTYNVTAFTDPELSRRGGTLHGTDIGSGYINNLADLYDTSGWHSEGDVVIIENTSHVTKTKTYTLLDALKQLGDLIYPQPGHPADGWQVVVKQAEKYIDEQLGTNCSQYFNNNPYYGFATVSDLKDTTASQIKLRDHFLDIVVKRYVYENARQAIAQLNYAWKVHQCRKDAFQLGDYNTTNYSMSDLKTKLKSIPAQAVPESFQGFVSVPVNNTVTLDSGVIWETIPGGYIANDNGIKYTLSGSAIHTNANSHKGVVPTNITIESGNIQLSNNFPVDEDFHVMGVTENDTIQVGTNFYYWSESDNFAENGYELVRYFPASSSDTVPSGN